MIQQSRLVVASILAAVVTLALSVLAVWLTGDPRAAGPVVIAAGVAVSAVVHYRDGDSGTARSVKAPDVTATDATPARFTKAA